MKIIIKVNDKKISHKTAFEIYGKDRMANRIKEAIEQHCKDPLTVNSWADGMEIIVQ